MLVIAMLGPALPANADVNARLDTLIGEIQQDNAHIPHVQIKDVDLQDVQMILIDVRQANEFAVSRIPNAINIVDDQALVDFAKANPKAKLVLYCSVGLRSAEKVTLLKRAGVNNATNMVGSIFAWANHGLPLENTQGVTSSVHPYNWLWGWRYLGEALHSYQP